MSERSDSILFRHCCSCVYNNMLQSSYQESLWELLTKPGKSRLSCTCLIRPVYVSKQTALASSKLMELSCELTCLAVANPIGIPAPKSKADTSLYSSCQDARLASWLMTLSNCVAVRVSQDEECELSCWDTSWADFPSFLQCVSGLVMPWWVDVMSRRGRALRGEVWKRGAESVRNDQNCIKHWLSGAAMPKSGGFPVMWESTPPCIDNCSPY